MYDFFLLLLLPRSLSISLALSLGLLLFVKLCSEKSLKALCARRVCVYVCMCVALCVFVILGFSAWLRLWLYFGSPISVAHSALWGP